MDFNQEQTTIKASTVTLLACGALLAACLPFPLHAGHASDAPAHSASNSVPEPRHDPACSPTAWARTTAKLMLKPGQFYVISSVLGVTGFALLLSFFRAPLVPSAVAAIAITFVFRLLAIFFDWRTKSVMRPPPSN